MVNVEFYCIGVSDWRKISIIKHGVNIKIQPYKASTSAFYVVRVITWSFVIRED